MIPFALLIGFLTGFGETLPSWHVFRVRSTLAEFVQSAADALTPPSQHALELQSLYWKPTILRALTEHGLMDAVDGRTDCRTIAANLGLHADFACRFLHAGISLDLIAATRNEKVYKLTPTGEYLRRDHPETVADLFDLVNSELFRESLHAAATKSIKSGRSGVLEAFDTEFFEYVNEHGGEIFDNAMNQISKNIARTLVHDWMPPTPNATVCDLGGGKGTIIAALCKHNPRLKGILFDLPVLAERAEQYIAQSGLLGRIDVVSGDFFAQLPDELRACDVFFLKAIFHDWGDSACVAIIKNIKDIAPRGAKIVGHDIILGIDGKSIENKKFESDVTMMAMCSGGKERTRDEYFALFESAGVRSKPRLVKLRDLTSVVEVDL